MNTGKKTLGLAIGWWAALALLGPLLWAQGRWARWRTPRLSPPSEPLRGRAGSGAQDYRLVVLGESPAAGIGVATLEESLPARMAEELAQRYSRPVSWRSMAVNGADIRAVLDMQVPQLKAEQPDLVVVVLGVNDTTGLTPRARWRAHLQELINAIRAAGSTRILFASLPRMDSFTALPRPLRQALGWRARLLDADLRQVAANVPEVICAAPLPPLTALQLAADRYHPSAAACRDWAVQLANHLQRNSEDSR